MRICSKLTVLLLALCLLTAAEAQDAEPPFHPSVGQKYVPTDVDWDRPVYRTGFDDASELSRWRLEGGRRVSIANGRLVLEREPGGRNSSLVCWLTTELPAEFLLEFSVRPRPARSERGSEYRVFQHSRRERRERLRPGLEAAQCENYHVFAEALRFPLPGPRHPQIPA